jgi:hypothetical protein
VQKKESVRAGRVTGAGCWLLGERSRADHEGQGRTNRAANDLQLVSLRNGPVVAECADNARWVRAGVLCEEDRPDLSGRASYQDQLPSAVARGSRSCAVGAGRVRWLG